MITLADFAMFEFFFHCWEVSLIFFCNNRYQQRQALRQAQRKGEFSKMFHQQPQHQVQQLLRQQPQHQLQLPQSNIDTSMSYINNTDLHYFPNMSSINDISSINNTTIATNASNISVLNNNNNITTNTTTNKPRLDISKLKQKLKDRHKMQQQQPKKVCMHEKIFGGDWYFFFLQPHTEAPPAAVPAPVVPVTETTYNGTESLTLTAKLKSLRARFDPSSATNTSVTTSNAAATTATTKPASTVTTAPLATTAVNRQLVFPPKQNKPSVALPLRLVLRLQALLHGKIVRRLYESKYVKTIKVAIRVCVVVTVATRVCSPDFFMPGYCQIYWRFRPAHHQRRPRFAAQTGSTGISKFHWISLSLTISFRFWFLHV